MIRRDLRDLLARQPFGPFQIKLVNGDIHKIFDPQIVALQT
jgi:hypothetical protein